MTYHRDRTIALVRLATPEDLAESVAGAIGDRARAVVLLEAAAAYLRTAP
jgi:hypothetical protein